MRRIFILNLPREIWNSLVAAADNLPERGRLPE